MEWQQFHPFSLIYCFPWDFASEPLWWTTNTATTATTASITLLSVVLVRIVKKGYILSLMMSWCRSSFWLVANCQRDDMIKTKIWFCYTDWVYSLSVVSYFYIETLKWKLTGKQCTHFSTKQVFLLQSNHFVNNLQPIKIQIFTTSLVKPIKKVFCSHYMVLLTTCSQSKSRSSKPFVKPIKWLFFSYQMVLLTACNQSKSKSLKPFVKPIK